MDSYPVNDHGMPGTGPPGPSQSPDIMQDQHLQQLHQSIQQQQQQLHQQLTSGSSSISDLIGMLPQTASLSSGNSMASPDYRSSSHLPLSSSPMYSRHSSSSNHGSSHSAPGPSHSTHSHQNSSDPHDRGEPSISSIAYTRQGDSFVCSLCGKVVVSKAAITRHIQLTHEKKKPFECNICHRRFGYKNILMEHQNIHFGIKPYACTLCDKRFAARSNLFQHRLLHMKPFCCYICNKRFDRDEQLQRHLKLHPTANVLSCSSQFLMAMDMDIFRSETIQYKSHSGHMSLTMDPDAMRRRDTICSQLASERRKVIRQENSQVKQRATFSWRTNLARSYSNPSDPEQGSPLSMATGRKDPSPIPGLESLASKFHNSPRFLPLIAEAIQ
ncbi:hypothetical protein Btru_035179 [Bulinus truncatus]|nr:hypothetical protein Btru_035179 [Bulinus truncatus]